MLPHEIYQWIQTLEMRSQLLLKLAQPMTVTQLSEILKMPLRETAKYLRQFRLKDLAYCLNPCAATSRVYWLTEEGLGWQERIFKERGKIHFEYDFPEVDWHLYGWCCNRHRKAVILALNEPLQGASLKYRITALNPKIRISANNVRDILRLMLAKGLVKLVVISGKCHPRYILTETGMIIQALLRIVEQH